MEGRDGDCAVPVWEGGSRECELDAEEVPRVAGAAQQTGTRGNITDPGLRAPTKYSSRLGFRDVSSRRGGVASV